MIIDGRALAKEILARAKARADKLARRPKVVALVASETPATKSYLAIKTKRAADAGCILEIQHIKSSLRPFETIDMCKNADALIVQLPLPADMNQKGMLDAIPVEKDADVLSSVARAKFEMMDLRNPSLLPPVVGAVREIFIQNNIDARGKRAVVIGDGWLVGNPCAVWLKQQGAEVSVLTSKSKDLPASLRGADIIVSGAGSPHLIKPEMLKQGVVLIDAGTSESNGTIAGDADPACADKCSIFTPVPGGIGPLSVASLFDNVVILAEQKNSSILSA